MNFLIISEREKIPKTNNEYLIQDEDDLKAIKKIHNKNKNHILRVILLGKGKTIGKIRELSQKSAKIEIDDMAFVKGSKKFVSLALGGLRPVMAKRVIEHSTTLGVKEIHLFPSDYSMKSYFDSNIFKNKKYLKQMKKGIAQGGNYDSFPSLSIHENYEQIDLKKFSKVCFLNKGENNNYFSKEIAKNKNLLMFVGPEKGWSKNEINSFKKLNFEEIIISESILRVEFAINSALSQLEYLRKN